MELKRGWIVVAATLGVVLFSQASVLAQTDANDPGILEPVLTEVTGVEVRIPNTDQSDGSSLLNLVGGVTTADADGATRLTGNTITQVTSPNEDLRQGLDVVANNLDFGGNPGTGEGFWFLVRMVTPQGNGTYDVGGSQVDSRDGEIDSASGGCP